jgi:hypothetical protein
MNQGLVECMIASEGSGGDRSPPWCLVIHLSSNRQRHHLKGGTVAVGIGLGTQRPHPDIGEVVVAADDAALGIIGLTGTNIASGIAHSVRIRHHP